MPRATRLDISAKIGPFHKDEVEWPMYSYDRGGWVLWSAIAQELHVAGWTETQIREWLQSKCARWALDGQLGTLIHNAAAAYVHQAILSGENVL